MAHHAEFHATDPDFSKESAYSAEARVGSKERFFGFDSEGGLRYSSRPPELR